MIILAMVLSACQANPLIEDYSIEPTSINIGASRTVARISFALNQPASVDIVLKNGSGSTFVLRQDDIHHVYPSGRHTFLFSGLVQGYILQDEQMPFEVIQRLVPDGDYSVVITAESGRDIAQSDHKLTVRNSITKLPTIDDFAVDPVVITPNEDGIDDAAKIILQLQQDLYQLTVYGVSQGGDAYPIPENESLVPPNSAGIHTYRFDALEQVGEKLHNELFYVIADAFDEYGQHIRWQIPLDVRDVGEVHGYILNGVVTYSPDEVKITETLCFSLTVLNSGDVYMRTIGPWSATTYQDSQNFVSMQYPEDKGSFRIGLDFESSDGQYPYRWAIGTPGVDLVEFENGWYLPPKHTGSVTGCVQFNEVPDINPQYAWLGLIHEQSDPQLVNHRVAPHQIKVVAESE